MHRAHAAAFLALAEEADRQLTGPGQQDWLERLDVEHNNLRAAMDWLCRDDPSAAIRMAAAMWLYWSLHRHFTEGRERLRQLLDLVPGETMMRVRALNSAGWLAIDQGDYPDADRLLGESAQLSRRLKDKAGQGMAAVFRCRSLLSSGREAQSAPHAERGFALLTEAADRPGTAFALFYMALGCAVHGPPGDRLPSAGTMRSHVPGTRLPCHFRARALLLLGVARLELGDLGAARAALREGLPGSVSVGDRFMIPVGLSDFAGLAARTASAAWHCGWPAQRRPAGRPTRLPCLSRTGRIWKAGWPPSLPGRRGGSKAHGQRAADDADGGSGVRAGRRARAGLAGRVAAGADPPRDAGRCAGRPRPDQPRHRGPGCSFRSARSKCMSTTS